MQQQTQYMPDQDALYTILADLKRTCREYTTAATECNCSEVRRTFTQLLNQSLQQQEQLYQFMKQHNMYNASSKALKQEVDKQVNQYQQTAQQTQQFLQQLHVQNQQQAQPYMHQQQQQQPYQSIQQNRYM